MGSIDTEPRTRTRVSASDIQTLKSLLASSSAQVLTPTDAGYAQTLKRWSQAAEKPAGVSVVPTSAEEVATVVKYAAEHRLDVAVKGGGHSTAGVSSTDGGLLLELGGMRSVRVDETAKLLYVGGGANWGDVDREAIKYGLATVGGTVADTGVGGLALGGGYGWLSGKYGLTIDCMVEVEIVVASGEILRCSEKENQDLFWAVRGAGQNFGVVTEFVLKAFEVPKKVWAGMLMFPPTPEHVEKVTKAVNNLYAVNKQGKTHVDGKGCGGLGFAKPPPAEGKILILVPVIYFGTEAEGKTVYKELYEAGPVADTTGMVDYPEINQLLAPPYGLRASMKGAAFEMPIRVEFAARMLKEYEEFTASNDDLGISMLLWELYDPVKVTELSVGSFANRGLHLNGMICPIWTDPGNDQLCRQWARKMNELFKRELQEVSSKEVGPSEEVTTIRASGKKATQFYGNYDHYDERSRDIFGDNYARLQGIKARYDPGNVFDKLFAITPSRSIREQNTDGGAGG